MEITTCRHQLNPIEKHMVTIRHAYWLTQSFERGILSDIARSTAFYINGPHLGKRPTASELYRKQLREEWLKSGERGEIEKQFGAAKRRYSPGRVVMKLKHTSEVDICASVLAMNL